MACCTLHGRRGHVAPAENCSCGFYAVTTLQVLFWGTLGWMSAGDTDSKVLGRVELAGKIIEHEYGYRAERARIAELIPIQGTERDVMRLGARLGLPVGHSVAPRIVRTAPHFEETMRVLLVDDDAVIRARLRAALGTADDVQIVGEAASGEEAVTAVEAFEPEVVFMDVRMPPGLSGIAATKVIRLGHPSTKVIFLTDDESEASILEAIKAGASGYLLHGVRPEELVNVARLVRQGKPVIDPAVIQALMSEVRVRPVNPGPRAPLSPREAEILRQVASGLTTPEVAAALSIAPGTVETHLRGIMEKLAWSPNSLSLN